jgi:adenylate cyclase
VLRKVVQRGDPSGRPPVTLIEDLHWMDPASEAFLAEWVEAIGTAGRLLVVNFRPEYRAAWMQKSYYRQIALTPLGPDAIRELLTDLLGNDESIAGLADTIHARSGGNPFFAEEIVQTLRDQGILVPIVGAGARGRPGEVGGGGSEGTHGVPLRLVRPIDEITIPATVRGLLGARIDRLEEHDKQVLQTAAVIGKEFSEPILRQVLAATAGAALAGTQLAQALATLRTREFLHETALYPVAEYSFKHPLTQEVALGSQLQERRRTIHAAVAQAIEATHTDKLDEHAALLAHHCAEAGQTLAAAQWHARAGAFIGRSDFAESARHWQRARELLRGVADDPSASAIGANACFRVLSLAFRLGLPEQEAHAIFQEGLDWAARTDDPLWAGRLHQAMSVFSSGSLRLDAAVHHAAQWERVAHELPDADRRACALWPTFLPRLTQGNLVMARTHCLQQIAWTTDHPDWGMRDWGVSALASGLMYLASVELMDGTLDQARTLLQRAIHVARSAEDREGEIWCIGPLGDLGFLAGEPDLARAAIEHAVRTSEPLGALSLQFVHGRLGRQLLLDGRPLEAVEALERALSFCSDGNRNMEPWLRQALAQAWLAAGDPARARAIAEDTLASCLQIGARLIAIEAALALSAALRAEGGAAVAPRIDEVLATADRLIAETGACNLAPFVLVERAALSELRGESQQRESYLRRALDGFAKMGATGQAARLSRKLG